MAILEVKTNKLIICNDANNNNNLYFSSQLMLKPIHIETEIVKIDENSMYVCIMSFNRTTSVSKMPDQISKKCSFHTRTI